MANTPDRWARCRAAGQYLFAAAVLLLLWEACALLLHNPALPQPLPAVTAFVLSLPHGLWQHMLISTYRVLVSMILGIVLAVPFGILIGREERLDRILAPHLYLLYPIPKIALLPVIFAIFKLGDASKIILITMIIFFQIVMTARDAAKKVPLNSVLSVRSLGASNAEIYRHVIIPACLPDIFTAVRISLGTAISVLFFAESFATMQGLGYYIFDAWSRIDYPGMFGGILAIALVGLVLFLLVDLLQRLLCPWLYA